MFGIDAPFSDDERARLRRLIEHTYDQFVDRVANARGLTPEAVNQVGGGRVWTGRQALERGLVDELGGLEAALVHARKAGGLPETARLRQARGDGGMGLPTGGAAGALAYAIDTATMLNRAGTWLLSPLWHQGA